MESFFRNDFLNLGGGEQPFSLDVLAIDKHKFTTGIYQNNKLTTNLSNQTPSNLPTLSELREKTFGDPGENDKVLIPTNILKRNINDGSNIDTKIEKPVNEDSKNGEADNGIVIPNSLPDPPPVLPELKVPFISETLGNQENIEESSLNEPMFNNFLFWIMIVIVVIIVLIGVGVLWNKNKKMKSMPFGEKSPTKTFSYTTQASADFDSKATRDLN